MGVGRFEGVKGGWVSIVEREWAVELEREREGELVRIRRGGRSRRAYADRSAVNPSSRCVRREVSTSSEQESRDVPVEYGFDAFTEILEGWIEFLRSQRSSSVPALSA